MYVDGILAYAHVSAFAPVLSLSFPHQSPVDLDGKKDRHDALRAVRCMRSAEGNGDNPPLVLSHCYSRQELSSLYRTELEPLLRLCWPLDDGREALE
jgi:hypothetical protein